MNIASPTQSITRPIESFDDLGDQSVVPTVRAGRILGSVAELEVLPAADFSPRPAIIETDVDPLLIPSEPLDFGNGVYPFGDCTCRVVPQGNIILFPADSDSHYSIAA